MTRQGITADMLGILQAPTPPERILQRPAPGGGNKSLSYVTARFVMDRLDEVGSENWQDRYEDRADGSVRCGIGVLIEGEWVWKWDVGTESNIEADKGSYSDAFKRAAVKWGIGRDLYPEAGATTSSRPVSASTGRPAPTPQPPTPAAAGGAPEEPEWVREQLGADEPTPINRDAPAGECPVHHLAWTLKPAGVSKTTGKPYKPFWACPSTERPFCQEKPGKAA